ncbi:VanZ family protein [Xylanimonas oleitrophica]|uniref:VanZ family protein n=1 Tax=Xylanimonas oleitrophica TaxID=2607479 RepID=UPI0015D03908|nr:VanZ family protein [Xylanimonas oleitrophica]
MRVLRWIFVLYLAAVLSLTLWPALEDTSVPGWAAATVTFLAGVGIRTSVEVLEMAANVVMFGPFGLLGTVLVAWPAGAVGAQGVAARRRWPARGVALAVAGVGFVFSAAIEAAQLVIPGRVSTLLDVLLNGAGALLGAALAVVVLTTARRAAARRAADG